MAIKLYLDMCCLCRPWDDQMQVRVRLEGEAVLALIEQMLAGETTGVTSQAHWYEARRIRDVEKRERIERLLHALGRAVPVTDPVKLRANDLVQAGFERLDALHLACAEAAESGSFITVDDSLAAVARRHPGLLNLRVDGPWEALNRTGSEEKK